MTMPKGRRRKWPKQGERKRLRSFIPVRIWRATHERGQKLAKVFNASFSALVDIAIEDLERRLETAKGCVFDNDLDRIDALLKRFAERKMSVGRPKLKKPLSHLKG